MRFWLDLERLRMKRNFRKILPVCILWTALSPGLALSQDAMPGFGVPQIIRLDPKGILPSDIRIKPGSTVIWLNSTRTFVTVVFADGEDTAAASESPTRFFMAPDGTFTSNGFAPGAVASIAFLTPGTYRYFVSGVKGDFLRRQGIFGSIVVK